MSAAEFRTRIAEPSFMGMPETITPVYWTADMACALPEDGNRYEVVYGRSRNTRPEVRWWSRGIWSDIRKNRHHDGMV